MDNTLKLRVILLCFVFAIFGYAIGNFHTLKAKFCEVGQTPTQTTISTEDMDSASIYIVKNGDTLDSISKLFNVSKEAIITVNKLAFPNLVTGSTLIIPNH